MYFMLAESNVIIVSSTSKRVFFIFVMIDWLGMTVSSIFLVLLLFFFIHQKKLKQRYTTRNLVCYYIVYCQINIMLNKNYQTQDYFLGIMKLSITSDTINWINIIKKEVRGINDTYLGKVQGISEPFIITEKGSIIKEKFYIPKKSARGI